MSFKGKWIRVVVSAQALECYIDEQLICGFAVSTSEKGLGEEPDSFKTPRGLHHIAQKIGEDAPLGAIFKARKFTGEIWTPEISIEKDFITTRILWLAGDEPRNATTFDRFVYIHGTNREDKIGQPHGKGCVRLKNADMIQLFDWVELGTPVFIQE